MKKIEITPEILKLVKLSQFVELLIEKTKTTDAEVNVEQIASIMMTYHTMDMDIRDYGFQIHAIENVLDTWAFHMCDWDDDYVYYVKEMEPLMPKWTPELNDSFLEMFKDYDGVWVDVAYD